MVDIANHRFPDIGARFDRAYDRVQGFRQDAAARKAGNYLTAGMPSQAAGALYGEGMISDGQAIEDRYARQQASAAKAEGDRKKEALEFTATAAGRLRALYDGAQGDGPAKTARVLQGFDQLTPQWQQYGETPEELAQVRQQLERDADTTLTVLGAAAAKEAGYEIRNAGEEVFIIDPRSGRLVNRFRGARTMNVPEGGAVYELAGEYGGPTAPAGQPTAGEPDADWLDAVAQAAGDAQVTSGYRDPAHNRRVGGAANSRHMTGEAVDLVPRRGETMAQLHARVRGVPGARAINEGDHVHVQSTGPRGGGQQQPAGPRLVVQRPKAPKEDAPPSGYRWGGDGSLVPIRGGPADPAMERAKPKAPTDGDKQTVAFAYRALRANDRMNSLIDRGLYKPETASAQLFDRSSNGAVRLVTKTNADRQFFQAAKEWLAPILRKDTGAAVTDEELATYMDIYIPKYEDDEQTIRQKAAARGDAMLALVRQGGTLYDQTYGPRKFQAKALPQRGGSLPLVRSPAEAARLPPGTRFRTPDGQERVRR